MASSSLRRMGARDHDWDGWILVEDSADSPTRTAAVSVARPSSSSLPRDVLPPAHASGPVRVPRSEANRSGSRSRSRSPNRARAISCQAQFHQKLCVHVFLLHHVDSVCKRFWISRDLKSRI